MAKVKMIDGIKYYPKRNSALTVCGSCTGVIQAKKLYYAKNQSDGNELYCSSCIQKLASDEECRVQSNKIIFPLEEEIHVGAVKYHVCASSEPRFLPVIAAFERGKVSKELRMLRCDKCGIYIMSTKAFEANRFVLCDYKCVKIKTGKIIPYYAAEGVARVPPMPSEIVVPKALQRAVRHPCQGGTFSGK